MPLSRATVCLFSLLLFCSGCLLQNRPRRAQRLITHNQYAKAYTLLHKELARDSASVAARWQLSRLLLDTAWNQHIDSAHYYILEAIRLAPTAPAKQRKKWPRLALDSTALARQHAAVDSAAFRRAFRANTVADYQYFINNYPLAAQLATAQALRNELAYAQASALNTWQAYQTFFQTYPQAEQAPEARELYEQLLFEERTQTGTLAAYRQFLTEHPTTPYKNRLLQNIYYLSTADNAEQSYRQYLQEFGLNSYGRQALTHLFYSFENPALAWQNLPLPDSLRPFLASHNQQQLAVLGPQGWQFISEEALPWPGNYADVHPDYLCESPQQLWAEVWNGQESAIQALNGKIIYAGEYEAVEELAGGLLKIRRQGLWGLFLMNGRALLPFRFQNISYLSPKLLVCRQGSQQGLLAPNGQWLLSLQSANINMANGAVVLELQNRYALTTPRLLVESQQQNTDWQPAYAYRRVQPLADSLVAAQAADSSWNIFSATTLEPVLQRLPNLPEVANKNTWVLAENSGYRVLTLNPTGTASPLYKQAHKKNGWLMLKDSIGWQARSLTRNLIKPLPYDSLAAYHPNLLRTFSGAADSLHFFVDGQAESIRLPPAAVVYILRPSQVADSLARTDPYLTVVEAGATSQVYTAKGQLLGQYKGATFSWPTQAIFLVKTRQGTKLYNNMGELMSKKTYEAAGNDQQGNLALLNQKKFGVYNPEKKWLLEPQFDAIPKPYSDSLYTVNKGGKWGLVDHQAHTVLKPVYTELYRWNDSLALTQSETYAPWQLINVKSGAITADSLMNLKWYGIAGQADYLRVEVGEHSGVLSRNHGWVVPPRFDLIENLGTNQQPIFYCERETEQGYQIDYYNFIGRKLFEKIYTEEEWLRLLCE